MKTNISFEPAQEAGKHITETLNAHTQQPVLFLISGGSALKVLDTIDTAVLGSNVTIVAMDERLTHDQNGNNFLQLSQAKFFNEAVLKSVHFIKTVPEEGERHEQFAARIGSDVDAYLQAHTDCFTLGLFGIGEDGHTASIFPATEQDFSDAYTRDSAYVAITRPQEQYPFRITITPAFIEEKISEVVLYAVGSKKCDNILSYMHTKNFGAHEIPALIPARHPKSTLFTDCQALV